MLILQKILNLILEIISPKECILCEKENFWLCDICEKSLKLNNKYLPKNTTAIYDYQDEKVKKIIYQIKYNNHTELAKELGMIIKNKINISKYDYIVPIPISKNRLKERGYNQVDYIIYGLCKEKYLNALIRIKNTNKLYQTNNLEERKLEIENAFTIKEECRSKIKNKNILVIDDITTTGATFYEIKKILEKENCKIEFLAIAH